MKMATVRRFALQLPEVTEQPHHHYASFRVRGRIFVTAPPGNEFIHVFVDETTRELALALDPAFLEKLFWAGKVVGLRVKLASAVASVVKPLIAKAWAQKAPREMQAPPGLATDTKAADASARRRVARPTRPQADVHE